VTPVVLLADGDPFGLGLLEEACHGAGYRTIVALDGTQALEHVARQPPSLLLVAAELAGVDGLEVLRILKADVDLAPIPVLVAAATEALRAQALELGADAALAQPYVLSRVQAEIRKALEESRDRRRRARESFPPLPSDARDPETGAGSVAQLLLTLDYELTRALRYGHALSLVVVRVAPANAATLRKVAELLGETLRVVDQVFRAGPEELAMVLPETDAEGAAVALERIRSQDLPSTLRYGRATLPGVDVRDAAGMVATARAALA